MFIKYKNIFSKIFLVLLIILVLFCLKPKSVDAYGGIIMKPICDFLTGIGDKIMDLTHNFLIGQEQSVIKVDFHDGMIWRIFKVVATLLITASMSGVVGIWGAIGIGMVANAFLSSPMVEAAAGKILAVSGLVFSVLVTGNIFVGLCVYNANFWMNEIAVVPVYALTPEEIFRK